MMSKNELSSGETDTIRRSKESTVITTLCGTPDSTEEGTVYLPREMRYSRHAYNRWWRTREGPELPCVQIPLALEWRRRTEGRAK